MGVAKRVIVMLCKAALRAQYPQCSDVGGRLSPSGFGRGKVFPMPITDVLPMRHIQLQAER
eukprot:7806216-Heterocapsa_arctica.AAC.1